VRIAAVHFHHGRRSAAYIKMRKNILTHRSRRSIMMNTLQKTVTIAAGRITAPRCQAKAKHSQEQCRKAVMRGKRVCRVHGENLLVHVLNKAENAARRLRLYMGGKHARNVRYALRSSVR
jgi:hypothetical protein